MNWKILIYRHIGLLWTAFPLMGQTALPDWMEGYDFLEGAQISIHAVDLHNGKEILSHFGDQYLIPASNMKLLSTAAGLDLLGGDFQFVTSIGYEGEIQKGSLNGTLMILGSGDPCINSTHWPSYQMENLIPSFLQACNERGIEQAKLTLGFYAQDWDEWWHHRDWAWQDIGNYYGISAGAFNIEENACTLRFNTSKEVGATAELLSIDPPLDMTWDNRVTIGTYSSGDQAYVFGNAEDTHRFIIGTVPKRGTSFQIRASLPKPTHHYTTAFRAELPNHWQIDSVFINPSYPKGEWNPLFEWRSPQLSAIAWVVNHYSHNLFAEAIYRYLEEKKPDELRVWKENNFPLFPHISWKDGCGLSPFNRLSAKSIVHLLDKMKNNTDFVASLAAPGEEGSLRRRLEEWDVRAKTGSMEGVRALSGYCTFPNGKKIAFSVLLNNVSVTHGEFYQFIHDYLLFCQ